MTVLPGSEKFRRSV